MAGARAADEAGAAGAPAGAGERQRTPPGRRGRRPADGLLALNTGGLSLEELNLVLGVLPIDFQYVDEHDRVRFYSEGHRIFPRSPGVIGRKVQNCHPPQSVHKVQQIIDAFRAGEKDTAEFWIEMQGKFLHIRYFAVRDEGGAYRGVVETVQDVTASAPSRASAGCSTGSRPRRAGPGAGVRASVKSVSRSSSPAACGAFAGRAAGLTEQRPPLGFSSSATVSTRSRRSSRQRRRRRARRTCSSTGERGEAGVAQRRPLALVHRELPAHALPALVGVGGEPAASAARAAGAAALAHSHR